MVAKGLSSEVEKLTEIPNFNLGIVKTQGGGVSDGRADWVCTTFLDRVVFKGSSAYQIQPGNREDDL